MVLLPIYFGLLPRPNGLLAAGALGDGFRVRAGAGGVGPGRTAFLPAGSGLLANWRICSARASIWRASRLSVCPRAARRASMSSCATPSVSWRALVRKSTLNFRNATACSIICFIPSRNCGERRYSSQDCDKACSRLLRICRTNSGGAVSGPLDIAACMSRT